MAFYFRCCILVQGVREGSVQGEQGVSAFNAWLEQGGDNHVLQVNKRVIEKRKGRGLFAQLWPVGSDISSQAAAGASFHNTERW